MAQEEKSITVGVTDYAQDKLGQVVFVEFPEIGREVEAGESVVVIESVKTVSDVYAPVSGKVTAVNEELLDRPELINEGPYEAGWIFRLEMSDAEQLDALMSPAEYAQFVEQEEEA